MARQRMIHPNFFIDDDVAMLSPWARLLFLSLLTQADREGRLEDKPGRIKAQSFPFDDVDINGNLEELVEQCFIARYEVSGRKLIQIRSFLKYQKPHHKEEASKLQACPMVEPCLPQSKRPNPPETETVPKTETETDSTDKAEGRDRPANPLVDRDRLCAEGYALIETIAPLADLDPTEVLNKASEWRGKGYVRMDSMSHDRLAHTLNALRRWKRSLTGESEPSLPAARAAPVLAPLTQKLADTMRELRGGDGEGAESGVVRGGSDRHRITAAKAG